MWLLNLQHVIGIIGTTLLSTAISKLIKFSIFAFHKEAKLCGRPWYLQFPSVFFFFDGNYLVSLARKNASIFEGTSSALDNIWDKVIYLLSYFVLYTLEVFLY